VASLFRQGDFIESAIGNLKEAIRDGAIMVTVVLFLFLLNFRTTFITLTAIPLSFAITLLTFRWFGVSVNSMTLGGIAVAIGMVVDDAIVDVENVFRRLRENAALRPARGRASKSSPPHPARCAPASSTPPFSSCWCSSRCWASPVSKAGCSGRSPSPPSSA
jgi:Cu/Ag efflux pump CusA